ncbi:hypothetical protein FKM82_011426 [Ascaphus truei]
MKLQGEEESKALISFVGQRSHLFQSQEFRQGVTKRPCGVKRVGGGTWMLLSSLCVPIKPISDRGIGLPVIAVFLLLLQMPALLLHCINRQERHSNYELYLSTCNSIMRPGDQQQR